MEGSGWEVGVRKGGGTSRRVSWGMGLVIMGLLCGGLRLTGW